MNEWRKALVACFLLVKTEELVYMMIGVIPPFDRKLDGYTDWSKCPRLARVIEDKGKLATNTAEQRPTLKDWRPAGQNVL